MQIQSHLKDNFAYGLGGDFNQLKGSSRNYGTPISRFWCPLDPFRIAKIAKLVHFSVLLERRVMQIFAAHSPPLHPTHVISGRVLTVIQRTYVVLAIVFEGRAPSEHRRDNTLLRRSANDEEESQCRMNATIGSSDRRQKVL